MNEIKASHDSMFFFGQGTNVVKTFVCYNCCFYLPIAAFFIVVAAVVLF